MTDSGCKKSIKEEFYLPEDRLFGRFLFFYYQGRKVLAFLAIAYAIPLGYFLLKFYLSGQSWSDSQTMFSWVPRAVLSSFLLLLAYCHVMLWGMLRVGSDAVFLHVLLELNDRCSNSSVIKWRQVAHSANSFSKELGESPIVFHSGAHCMRYVDNWAVGFVSGRRSHLKDESWEVANLHHDIAMSAVEKHKARVQYSCEELESFSLPLTNKLKTRKEELALE